MAVDFGSEFLQQLLGEFPRGAYEAARSYPSTQSVRPQGSRRASSFFDDEFAAVQREFEGRSAQALREGRLPDQTFMDFLSDPNFFEHRRASASPRARSDFSTQLFSPSVSFSRPLR
jgi:hypothetical protein